jgi:spore maturation protein CgeB
VKIVIFGLTISSSWGNGHATLWRGLCKALIRMGHTIVFYERDVPYYADMRDLDEIPGGRLKLYGEWDNIRTHACADVADADVVVITSYCPDSLAATEVVLAQDHALRVFYDLDTPITLARLDAGERVPYIGASGFRDFDLVLSYSGGRALDEFRERRSMVMSIRTCIVRRSRCRIIALTFPTSGPTRKIASRRSMHCWLCRRS